MGSIIFLQTSTLIAENQNFSHPGEGFLRTLDLSAKTGTVAGKHTGLVGHPKSATSP